MTVDTSLYIGSFNFVLIKPKNNVLVNMKFLLIWCTISIESVISCSNTLVILKMYIDELTSTNIQLPSICAQNIVRRIMI